MASIRKLKTSQSIQFFDHGTAFNLVQAFHRHLELSDLLQGFFAQAHTLLECIGVRYQNPADHIDMELGQHGPHTTQHKLDFQDANLGELTLQFPSTVSEHALATAEDLAALVMSPINNALNHRRALLQIAEAVVDSQGQMETPDPKRASAVKTGDNDTLVLISLDGFTEIRDRDGSEWAQALVNTMQDQIREGLRGADGVFQIDDQMLALLLPGTTSDAALEVAKKVRALISRLQLGDGIATSQLTACMGIAGTGASENAEQALQQARAALQAAQRDGNNNIEIFGAN